MKFVKIEIPILKKHYNNAVKSGHEQIALAEIKIMAKRTFMDKFIDNMELKHSRNRRGIYGIEMIFESVNVFISQETFFKILEKLSEEEKQELGLQNLD